MRDGEDPDEVLEDVIAEFRGLGKMVFSFDSGTSPAIKQARQMMLMAKAGALNLEIDEIGNNLLGNVEALTVFLELYDMGKVKQKLTKNTKENTRVEELHGITPANLMLFGTPVKLFDGGAVEDALMSFLSTGYGRRCFFGYTTKSWKNKSLTAEDIYDMLTSKTAEATLKKLATRFTKLASLDYYNKKIAIPKEISIILIEYRIHCERLAEQMGTHEELRKAEISHRYFKAMKYAGALAFIDDDEIVTENNVYHAIHLAEESGVAFERMLNQDKPYVKLAKYIATIKREVTHVDITENLPFYKGTSLAKKDMLLMATTWGYRHSIVIKKRIDNGIEFISGEALVPTELDKMYLAYSKDITVGYANTAAPFNKLQQLLTQPSLHWINHHTTTGRRLDDHITPGFNMVVIDVDEGTTVQEVCTLLKDYTFLIHTTKRHANHKHRFRLILPITHIVKLNAADFKDFMSSLHAWLPFSADVATGQRSRKWLTCDNAHVKYNEGQLLDALMFIPRTDKNEAYKDLIMDNTNMTHLERWFITNTSDGNRNNQILRYAMVLVDMGHSERDIHQKVLEMNSKYKSPLTKKEIIRTVMVTVKQKLTKKGL